jgi:four helix bundle protein
VKKLPRAGLVARQFLCTVRKSDSERQGNTGAPSGKAYAVSVVMAEKTDTRQISGYKGSQDIRERAFEFACEVVKLCQKLYDGGGVGRLLVTQLLTCSSSTATMLEEGRAAESDVDFVSKCSISLKECREAWTRLRICARCRLGPPADVKELVQESSELIAIISTIIRNKRLKMKMTTPRRRSAFRLLNS